MTEPPEIEKIFRDKIAGYRARISALSRRELAFSILRLVVFFTGIMLWIALIRGDIASPVWPAASVILFVLLLLLHRRYARAIHACRLGESFYQAGLARLEHRWAGTGLRGAHYETQLHPFSADLDLFGKGSLFELLCLAATRSGQDTLADWLLNPAPPDEVRLRQEAVRELTPRLEDREHLYRIMRDTPRTLDTVLLAQWGAAPPIRFFPWERLAAVALSAASLIAFAGWMHGNWGGLAFLLAAALQYTFVTTRLRTRVDAAISFCERTGQGLMACIRFFEFIESARFAAPRLREHQEACLREGRRASTQIRRLNRLVGWLNDGRHNTAFIPLARLLCWSTHFAMAIERWRRENGAAIAAWMRAAGQIEVLASLAAFAHENPDHAWPEVIEGETALEAEALGHPLIPAPRCVPNDLRLDAARQLLIVSGSNMSGKSTFLRTVGINVVLARAGAPVRARKMSLGPLALYALIRKNDSLADGFSRFYREIQRVHEAIEMAGQRPPLLFLMDEIFDGTNSHDRRVAAEAIVRTLLARGALGLITSHDLALTEIAAQLAPRAANVHFEDQLDGGRLVFDHRLREGAVQRGNALILMRSIGLDV